MSERTLDYTGYCGLHCAECFSYKKTVSEAAKALRRELHSVKLKDFWTEIPFLGEYENFKKSLDGLAKLRCTKTCRAGGGNPWCKMRSCCVKKNIAGCWECVDFEVCNRITERHKKELRQIKKAGIR